MLEDRLGKSVSLAEVVVIAAGPLPGNGPVRVARPAGRVLRLHGKTDERSHVEVPSSRVNGAAGRQLGWRFRSDSGVLGEDAEQYLLDHPSVD